MKKPIIERKMLFRLMKLYKRHFGLLRRILKGKYILLTDLEIAKMELLK